MFGSMQRRWEMRRLMSRLDTARRRKDLAMEAFVSGEPNSPIIAPYSVWSERVSERPDATHVADAIEQCEEIEARLATVQYELQQEGAL
jgi:hypothetical protein